MILSQILLLHTHIGTDFFPEGERMPQKVKYPQNASRGGVKFGVTEGGKGGGERKFSPQLRTTHKKNVPFLPHLGTFLVALCQKCLIFCLRGGGE